MFNCKKTKKAIIVWGIIAILYGCNLSNDTLIPVQTDTKWGYINLKGKYVINPQFDNAGLFLNGLAKVQSSDGKTGYIDHKGQYIIPAIYKDGTNFREGLAFVVLEGGYPICINQKGKTIFEMKGAEIVYEFSEGLAMFVNDSEKFGFVDKTGKTVIDPQFDEAESFFSNLARIMTGEKYGFISKDGKIVIHPQFDELGFFSEGKAAFSNGNKWGYIDKKGAIVIHPQFDEAGSFSKKLALVKQEKSWGYINKKGKFVINPQFDEAHDFVNGLAIVKQGDSYGYINKKGKFEINPQFDAANHFGNFACVQSAGKWGFINKKGQYVINPQFEDVTLDYSEINFVTSNYYDASEFIKLFFEKDEGSRFDGINASTSLQNLVDHRNYRGKLNTIDLHRVVYEEKTALTKDISIDHVLFYFNEPIGDGWGKYDYKVKTVAIEYKLSLDKKAKGKGNAIAMAMRSDLECRYRRQMEFVDNKYFMYHDDNKFSFVIFNDNDDIHFIVSLKTEKWNCGNNGSNVTATLIAGNLYIRGTGAMKNYDSSMTGGSTHIDFMHLYENYDPPQWIPWGPFVNVSYYLSNVVIENGVTSIGDMAFYFCKNLVSVTIPNSVTTIGKEAFYSCYDLTKIINHATKPQKIDNDVYYFFDECVLYVPASSISAYRAAEGWKEVRNIEAIPGN